MTGLSEISFLSLHLFLCPAPRVRRRQTEHSRLPLRRHRLGRVRLSGRQGHSDAAHRFDRQERRALHARLRLRAVLQPDARRPDDRPLSDALRPRVQQHRAPKRAVARRNDDGRALPRARLRDVRDRQVAPRREAGASGRRRAGFDEFYGTLANTPFFHPRMFVDSRVSERAADGR